MKTKFTSSQSIISLKLYKDKNEIKIPDVQRELVWTKSQKQLLIDSLFKDYDIPKIYFRDVAENGIAVHYVIDGQQRLNAIFGFMNDDFEMPKDADPVGNEVIANKKYSDLSSELQIIFHSRSLDVVHLVDYNDEEIDETFLRLQNGTPLKAAEKRRAIAGEMRNVVKTLSQSDIFNYCDFDNSHYAYEDITTKVLKQIKTGMGSISAQTLQKFYEDNPKISIDDVDSKKVKQAFNFLVKAFKHTSDPHLKKYSVMDLSVIANSLLAKYDLSQYAKQFGEVYLQFSNERILNSEKDEVDQDPKLQAYSNAARGDSLEYVEYRQNLLREYFIENMPYLVVKDGQRLFTAEQRAVIYRLGGGKCACCGNDVNEDGDYQADHIIPHSRGGRTQISNGQILCATCNKSKGNRTE